MIGIADQPDLSRVGKRDHGAFAAIPRKEDLAAAFSEIESGAEEAPEGAEDIVFSSTEIAGKKWITMDMTGMMGDIEGASDLGLTIKMYLRKFDAKLIYIMVMAADSEAADAFIATIEPAE